MPILHVEKPAGEPGGDQELKVVEVSGLPAWAAGTRFDVVGRPHARLEGAEKVTGRARYTYDTRLPGQLYARVLRSPLPHARIVRIDTARAAALPGVHAVLSSANAPAIDWYEETKLFDSTVRFIGDEVAAVAADSEEIAEDALRLIEVEYEPLPFVVDLAAALQPGAPHLYQPGNIAGEPQKYDRGDVAAGFRSADVIVEQFYTTQAAIHNSLEPHGTTAAWEDDKLTLYASTQGIFAVRKEVAKKLGLPEHHVRVIKQHMGGGFGSKQIAWKQDAIAALLSKQAGRPVQLMLDREAESLAVGNRNATRQRVRIGATRDGTITAIEARIELQTGAYQVGGEASDVSGIYQTLYRCANVHTEQVAVYTNTGPAVAFRAPGYVEGAFALESAMDELAEALGLDPIELRLRNYAEENQSKGKPYTSPDSLRQCYQRVADEFGWPSGDKQTSRQEDGATRRPGDQETSADSPLSSLSPGLPVSWPGSPATKRRGIGFAAHNWPGGSGQPPGYAWIKLNHDGSAEVITGTQDIGTGSRTGLAQIAAEELGLPIERIALHLGDTASGPYSPTSAGSMTLATLAPAVRAAAIDVKRQLCEAAAPILEEEAGHLVVRGGQVAVIDEPARAVDVAEVCGRIAPHMIQGQGARGPNPDDQAIGTFGAQCAEVEVDLETGEVTLLRVVASHDCGRIINPTTVDSQVIGGVTQGLGFALTEERIVDARSGVVLNANLEEYKVPTVADIPAISHARLDMPDLAANPVGAKGIGEPPLIPTAPAIANAVYDAIGVRVRHLPLTRQRLVDALAQQPQQRQGDDHAAV
jgi:xanthine dehydrogenase YagR molybdenum-binding subunit